MSGKWTWSISISQIFNPDSYAPLSTDGWTRTNTFYSDHCRSEN